MTELRRGGLIRGGTTILWTFDCSVGNQEIFFYSVSWVSHFHIHVLCISIFDTINSYCIEVESGRQFYFKLTDSSNVDSNVLVQSNLPMWSPLLSSHLKGHF